MSTTWSVKRKLKRAVCSLNKKNSFNGSTKLFSTKCNATFDFDEKHTSIERLVIFSEPIYSVRTLDRAISYKICNQFAVD